MLPPGGVEVRCAIPQLGAEEYQHLPGEQGHIRATILRPERQQDMWEQRGGHAGGGGRGKGLEIMVPSLLGVSHK